MIQKQVRRVNGMKSWAWRKSVVMCATLLCGAFAWAGDELGFSATPSQTLLAANVAHGAKSSNLAINKRASRSEVKKLSKSVQKLKKEVIKLNKDLILMEEKLLFPSSTKYSVFVSISSGQFFTLESIKLKLDSKLVATHIYSDKQRDALKRGGIQKLFVTNLNQGKHTATAFFTGLGPNGRAYKRAANIDFEKGPGSGYLELSISDDGAAQEPVFKLKQW